MLLKFLYVSGVIPEKLLYERCKMCRFLREASCWGNITRQCIQPQTE